MNAVQTMEDVSKFVTMLMVVMPVIVTRATHYTPMDTHALVCYSYIKALFKFHN